jgi:hypothetical protein
MSGGAAGGTGGGGGYQRTSSVPDAENFARGLGVGIVQYPDSDPAANDPAVIYEIANNMNEALEAVRARGVLDVPNRIETCRLYFIETNTRAQAWAVYVHDPLALSLTRSNWLRMRRAIVINPRPEWTNVAQEVQAMHQGGSFATGDPHHLFYHEVGHFLWRTDHPRRNQVADSQALQAALPGVRPWISGRAVNDVPEFVSEVFAQLMVGATPLHPDVEQLYRQLGGRII